MGLVFLPEPARFFAWGADATFGAADRATVVTPDGRRAMKGRSSALLETVEQLAARDAAELRRLPPCTASWALASKLALELTARERMVPTVVRHGDVFDARWVAALSAGDDAARALAIAEAMPPAAHAAPIGDEAFDAWAPDALVRAFLDAVVDALARSNSKPSDGAWEDRLRAALAGSDASFAPRGFAERSLAADLQRWSEPAIGARDRLRACFRLELPAPEEPSFALRFLLQSPDDPSLVVPAADVWQTKGRTLEALGRAFRDPQESLLEALGRAARLFPPIQGALSEARPERLDLDPTTAWSFLGDGGALLAEAGFGVIVPSELTSTGRRRLRLKMRAGSSSKVAGMVSGAAGLGLDSLLDVEWAAVIGDDALTEKELRALAKQKAPLVRHRGEWVAVDPNELAAIRAQIANGPDRLTMRELVQGALAGEVRQGALAVAVEAAGAFAELLARLRDGAAIAMDAPASLQATLRPYQQRGLAWLSTMNALGLGACLADDMGLGKTVQLLAFLLRRREEGSDARPTLLIAPTSVVGNWEREIERFAPSIPIARHYGGDRARAPDAFPSGALVLSTYGLLRRDAELLGRVEWSAVVLDEAQNIKNAASATARAARSLRASTRFALTGTPVENRLAELWSILEFANPGVLGPLVTFRREFAVPIERYGNESAAERLRRIVSPFVLRRVKTDPAVIDDLPAKNEASVVCTLTREQASLYKAVVNEAMRKIEEADGIARRGMVLALLTALKQVCNHPAQYLGERGPLAGRSGKLARLTEMLEEALAAGDKALLFTQYREMGERLVLHLESAFGGEIAFLHGGTSKKARDAMVTRFQSDDGPQIFVLSLKAGGTGLNLTRASHVFHYDRWWNPAVEDQATDRAYRIGQKRSVQVHKLLCAGTVEEKVDELLAQKRALAKKVVGSGEKWITELANAELRELFALSGQAVVDDDITAEKKRRPKKERTS